MCPLGAGLAQVVVHVGGEDDGLVVHIKGVHHVVGLHIQLNVFLNILYTYVKTRRERKINSENKDKYKVRSAIYLYRWN